MMEPIVQDDVDQAEQRFPFPDLLELRFFSDMRADYRDKRDGGWPVGQRNYLTLLRDIREIYDYNQQHAKSFARRLCNAGSDKRNSDAVFAEVIVYHYYIRLVHEGLISRIELQHDQADVIVVRQDGTRAYLEVSCIMPKFSEPSKPGEIVVHDIKTHLQEALGSIRQKLLRKIGKQGQMCSPRDNFAVIELNNHTIANDFTVLSSLSSGYKVCIDVKTGKSTSEGYDWRESVFDDESTPYLKGIIYFFMGIYETRRFIFNPSFREGAGPEPAADAATPSEGEGREAE